MYISSFTLRCHPPNAHTHTLKTQAGPVSLPFDQLLTHTVRSHMRLLLAAFWPKSNNLTPPPPSPPPEIRERRGEKKTRALAEAHHPWKQQQQQQLKQNCPPERLPRQLRKGGLTAAPPNQGRKLGQELRNNPVMTPSLIVLCTPNDKPPRLSTFQASNHRAPPSPQCMQHTPQHNAPLPKGIQQARKAKSKSNECPSQEGRVHWQWQCRCNCIKKCHCNCIHPSKHRHACTTALSERRERKRPQNL
ncbi:hypothetical protein VPH35_117796 [Triticum aestivum]|uniref:Uncharacterized protein n=1 Tax=Aegilops tauschii subsp. strangulata TaxID=200361 RepID=A0A453PD73_AEGTS